MLKKCQRSDVKFIDNSFKHHLKKEGKIIKKTIKKSITKNDEKIMKKGHQKMKKGAQPGMRFLARLHIIYPPHEPQK